jgi:ATP-dependent phosphofructokinase / diphosphate-dependent phosphofructokinase
MAQAPRNLLYAQSGGVTAVINATAGAVIATARKTPGIGKVFAGRNGILGILREELIDTGFESDAAIARLRDTPGGAFGSCRYKLKGLSEHHAQYERLIEVFRAHDIGYFLYNGGNDSADTAHKVSQIGVEMGYPLVCIGVPKTVDNDLPITDCCPGFGSVAKYVATSIREASFDVASMSETSTKVFVLEVMGRHAGWITAACALANEGEGLGPLGAPQIVLLPEVPFDEARFSAKVREVVARDGFCSIAVSEGLKSADGKHLTTSGKKDAFGHEQLGGAGQWVAQLVQDKLGLKVHTAVADYLQRSARHLASATDLAQAEAVGRRAVEMAVAGRNAMMPVIRRLADEPYRWEIAEARLADIANVERKVPPEFITADGFGITEAGLRYLRPLVAGEVPPPYRNGLPDFVCLQCRCVEKQLPASGF